MHSKSNRTPSRLNQDIMHVTTTVTYINKGIFYKRIIGNDHFKIVKLHVIKIGSHTMTMLYSYPIVIIKELHSCITKQW